MGEAREAGCVAFKSQSQQPHRAEQLCTAKQKRTRGEGECTGGRPSEHSSSLLLHLGEPTYTHSEVDRDDNSASPHKAQIHHTPPRSGVASAQTTVDVHHLPRHQPLRLCEHSATGCSRGADPDAHPTAPTSAMDERSPRPPPSLSLLQCPHQPAIGESKLHRAPAQPHSPTHNTDMRIDTTTCTTPATTYHLTRMSPSLHHVQRLRLCG